MLLEGADKEGELCGGNAHLGGCPLLSSCCDLAKKEDFHLDARVGTGMLLEMEQAGNGQVVACLAKQGSPMQPS